MRKGPLVVGVDGSPESRRALREAVDRAAADTGGGGLDLVVVFVRQASWASMSVDAGRGMADALDQMESDARRAAGEALAGTTLSWRFETRVGEPARELVKVAEAEGTQTIVVGGHRHGALGSAIVHSVDSELVHGFAGSLVIVRPPLEGGAADPSPDRSGTVATG